MNQSKNERTFKVSKFVPNKSKKKYRKSLSFKSLPAEIDQAVTKKALLGYTKT